ncbi:AAA family ATPase [Azospirillum sp.]|uniref:ParA family protein n=1 Tax=Azospirillum sp. TaxID=34012 RepID=UPI002D3C543D|nr:AAA family ATPase [Azospirillum sp.]HYD70466.1 AAA family ATPase [Azospirillum sp.]
MADKTVTDVAKAFGAMGGKARARKLSAEERSASARKAAAARWNGVPGSEPAAGPVPDRAVGPRPPAKVVAVANQKGGVGKTTTSVNLSAALAAEGCRVMLLDADPQANATIHMGVNPFALEQNQATLYHVLHEGRGGQGGGRPAALADIVVAVGTPAFDLVPACISLSAAETELTAQPLGALALKEKLAAARDQYDAIIIDCPPHLGMMTINALSAADYVLIPVETEPFAAMGISYLLDTVTTIQRRGNPSLSLLGLLPTKFKGRLNQDKSTLADLEAQLGPAIRVFAPITSATIYPQSQAAGRATVEVAGANPSVAAYRTLARELLPVLTGREVSHGA